MTPFALLGLMALVLGAGMLTGTDEAGDIEADDDTPPPPDPVEEPDTGATFDAQGDTISIELGEDETGRLVAVRSEIDTQTPARAGEDLVSVTDAALHFYLVPEGEPFPPNVDAVIATLSDEDLSTVVNGPEAPALPLHVYLDNLGVPKIGEVDLGQHGFRIDDYPDPTQSPTYFNTIRDGIEIEANAPFETYEAQSAIQTLEYRGEAPDPLQGTVAGDPLMEITPETLTDVWSRSSVEADVSLNDGLLRINIDPDIPGQLFVVNSQFDTTPGASCCSDGTGYSLRVYLAPESPEGPPSILNLIEDAAPNSEIRAYTRYDEANQTVGSFYLDSYFYFREMELRPVASIDLGEEGYTSLIDSERFDTVIRDYDILSNRPFYRADFELGEDNHFKNTSFTDTPELLPANTRVTGIL